MEVKLGLIMTSGDKIDMESFLTVVISVYLVMIVAEFGDKTNLIALSLMGKNPPYYVALFSTLGIAISTVFSVVIGGILGSAFPLDFIRYPAAFVFIWLGVSALREEDDDLEEGGEGGEITEPEDKDPFYRIMYLVALAELGDKSQIFAITAAAASFPLAVFIGSTLGMGTIMFLTAALGSLFFDRIDAEKMEKIAAVLFIVAGLWIGISTFLG